MAQLEADIAADKVTAITAKAKAAIEKKLQKEAEKKKIEEDLEAKRKTRPVPPGGRRRYPGIYKTDKVSKTHTHRKAMGLTLVKPEKRRHKKPITNKRQHAKRQNVKVPKKSRKSHIKDTKLHTNRHLKQIHINSYKSQGASQLRRQTTPDCALIHSCLDRS